MTGNILGLKIDVDTYVGMKRGVPKLLEILDRFGVKATFFLSLGPDASGRAILQLLKNPRFLKKMARTNAAQLYGFKTALYGTLLPSPKIALSFPDLVRRIIAEGHEVAFHAWDHRRWQDDLATRSDRWVADWFRRGVEAYVHLVGHEPRSFGAPAWTVDDRALAVVKTYPFTFLSCSRAQHPFIETQTGLVEIPSDLPCLEEIGVEGGVDRILVELKKGGLHILPVHAEAEGGIWADHFIALLEKLSGMDYRIVKLEEIREMLALDLLERRPYRMALLPGRAVPCCV